MRVLCLLFALLLTGLSGCIVEGEACPTTGWSDTKQSCVGPELYECRCDQFNGLGECEDEVGTWTQVDLFGECTCQAFIAGLCAVPVG